MHTETQMRPNVSGPLCSHSHSHSHTASSAITDSVPYGSHFAGLFWNIHLGLTVAFAALSLPFSILNYYSICTAFHKNVQKPRGLIVCNVVK